MARRKNRKKNSQPNIPKATLDRARRQAGVEDTPEEESPAESASGAKSEQPERKTARRRSSSVSPAQLDRAKKRGELEPDFVEDMLANPTKFVTEEELHEEYGFVLTDLRNMGILAAILLVVLVLLAQFL